MKNVYTENENLSLAFVLTERDVKELKKIAEKHSKHPAANHLLWLKRLARIPKRVLKKGINYLKKLYAFMFASRDTNFYTKP